MPAPQHRNFDPAQNFPSVVMDALQKYLSGLSAFRIRIKPGAANTLQVPAGDDNNSVVALPIEGKWRFVVANVEQAGSGGAGARDVWAVTTANAYAPGTPGEVDTTDYSFQLRVQAVGVPPVGFAHIRKVADAYWDGAAFRAVTCLVGGALTAPPFTFSGPIASLPPAGVDGRVYRATDTGQVMQDTGASWVELVRNVTQPRARARRTVAVAVASTSLSSGVGPEGGTILTFPTEDYDTDGCFTAGGSVLTVVTPGLYVIDADIRFNPSTGTTDMGAYVEVVRAGSAIFAEGNVDIHDGPIDGTTDFFNRRNVCFTYPLIAGDTVRLRAFHKTLSSVAIDAVSATLGFARISA